MCMVIVALFAFIVLRGLLKARVNEDPFCRFATAGLVLLFGIQASINMAVNLHLMPAKGMTLPFISYGGSSLISLGDRHGLPASRSRASGRARKSCSTAQGHAPDRSARGDSSGSRRGMTEDNLILLAAGGTGGHLFPAQALAHALTARGGAGAPGHRRAGAALWRRLSRPRKFTKSPRRRRCGGSLRPRPGRPDPGQRRGRGLSPARARSSLARSFLRRLSHRAAGARRRARAAFR